MFSHVTQITDFLATYLNSSEIFRFLWRDSLDRVSQSLHFISILTKNKVNFLQTIVTMTLENVFPRNPNHEFPNERPNFLRNNTLFWVPDLSSGSSPHNVPCGKGYALMHYHATRDKTINHNLLLPTVLFMNFIGFTFSQVEFEAKTARNCQTWHPLRNTV